MDKILQRPDTFAPSLPAWAVAAIALAAVAVWAGSHWLRRRMPNAPARWGLLAARVGVATAALWLVLQAAGRVLLLATAWPLWQPALMGAVVIEGVIALSARERQVVSRGKGAGLLALRVALAVLLMFVLTQPILSSLLRHDRERVVAVFVDESVSMDLVDKQMSASEKVQLARLFETEVGATPVPLAEAGSRLRAAGKVLSDEADRLDNLAAANVDAEALRRQLAGRRADVNQALQEAAAAVKRATDVLDEATGGSRPLDAKLRRALSDVRRQLHAETDSRAPLAQAGNILDGGGESMYRSLRPMGTALRRAAEALGSGGAVVIHLAQQVDTAFFESLSPAQRDAMARAVQASRLEVARRVLGGEKGLLAKLSNKYTLRLYRFARDPVEVQREHWDRARPAPAAPPAAPGGAAAPARPPNTRNRDPWRAATDYRSALEKAMQDIPGDELAGALLVTDGQHNVPASAEAQARRYGRLKAPVCTVLVGSQVPPVDAAIAGVKAPEKVYLGDRVSFDVSVRIANLRGKEARIRLLLDEKLVEEKTLPVPVPDLRTKVVFSHKPTAPGVHRYRVEIDKCGQEPILVNNTYPVNVGVVDDRTKLLIVEYRPRWEFRYLRNLFSGRDRSVFLQYVLLRPDRLPGTAARPRIPASVTRDFGDAEATALPETAEDWLKFDAIILGDVPPAALTDERIQILRRFVAVRGGALVVICGPNAMPHAYDQLAFRELLPMECQQSPRVQWHPPEAAYRLRLTAEGREHPVMRQADHPAVSQMVWGRMPKLHWRHPGTSAKPGASVLAYAQPTVAAPGADQPAARAAGEDALQADRASQRARALIAEHRYGSGRVMMLSFDRTWRLRYRVGDRRHHSFWGQALRWATSEQLQAGTKRVRLGTDRLVYRHGQPVVVKARVLDRNLSPVPNGKVAVRVYLEDATQPILTKDLTYQWKAGGTYQADLGPMPATGTYRIELVGRDVEAHLEPGQAGKIETKVIVLAPDSGEMVELRADAAVPNRLAALSGGAVEAPATAANLIPYFGKGSESYQERRDVSLWDSWPVLAIILIALSAEWIFRKKEGLT